MFSLADVHGARTPHGPSRREFLVGGLALGGLTLPGLLALRSQASAVGRFATDRSVVLLFLQGGPSQIETFDPKMTAPREIRSVTGEVTDALAGRDFWRHLPTPGRSGRPFDCGAFVCLWQWRSSELCERCRRQCRRVPMGTVYARVAGPNHPRTGMPTNVLVRRKRWVPSLKSGRNFETQSLQSLVDRQRKIGASYGYFDPPAVANCAEPGTASLPRDRSRIARQLLRQLDTFRRRVEDDTRPGDVGVYEQGAYEVIVRGIARLRSVQGRSQDNREIRHQRAFKLEEVTSGATCGGRRTCWASKCCWPAGCRGRLRFRDRHGRRLGHALQRQQPRGLGGMRWLAPRSITPSAAFLEDVKQRGLSDKILLVVSGEMGRTPQDQQERRPGSLGQPDAAAAGRRRPQDGPGHRPVRRQAGAPATEKYTPANLLATVMQTLLDVGQVRVASDVPSNVVNALGSSTPIRELI